MNASVVAALLNDNLATLLQACVRVVMRTGAMCADFFFFFFFLQLHSLALSDNLESAD